MKYYAVKVGRVPGIYTDWPSCQAQVTHFSGAQYKSFSSRKLAEDYCLGEENYTDRDVVKETSGDRTVIYTDGSCISKVGGFGWVRIVDLGDPVSGNGRIPGDSTNQIAELYAIWEAVQSSPNDKIDLYTDSKYSIGCLTLWWKTWQRNGWKTSKGEPVANKELIETILKVLKTKDVRFYHVKGHSGNKWNELCDQLANEGRSM